jgi:2-polyprenyl-3-methyl-5-hydroxy-6-metoxy-1,4-benzoquinol methylase
MDHKTRYVVERQRYGFWAIRPTPSKEEITRFYANEFYSGDYKNFNDSSLEVQVNDLEFYEGSWGDVADSIQRLSGRTLDGQTILDIGCGWGLFLEYMSRLGMKCYGFDPAPEAVAYASSKGASVKLAGLDKIAVFDDQRFDVVTLNNVLEHLSDPIGVVSEVLTEVLSPDGLLVIDVPNEFNAFQLAGRDTHGLADWWVAPPAHLNYFSNESLSDLLEGEGYDVLHSEASFPLEMFLLFGECYVGDGTLGKEIHRKRVNFELNMRRNGQTEVLRKFYKGLAQVNLGRQVRIYARPKQ